MKLLCFDLDNTLISSDKAHVLAYNYALDKLGFGKMPFKNLSRLFGMPHEGILKNIAQKATKKEKELLVELHNKNYKVTSKYVKAIKGIKPTLRKLKKNYKIAVVSNATHQNILIGLRRANINYRLFDLIIGNDDVRHGKPFPDEILKASKLFHHKADYIIGDSIYDIKAGKRAKVKTISILSGDYSKETLKKENPYKILKSIKDLPEFLEKEEKNK